MTDAEWVTAALARVEAILAPDPRVIAAMQVQAAVRLWVDATLHVDDVAAHERFEQRLSQAIALTEHDWCDGEVSALDVARTLHTCTRAARLHSRYRAALTSDAAPVKHVS